MFTKTECSRVRSNITVLSLLEDDKVIFNTKYHGSKILSPEGNTLRNLTIELLGPKTTAIAFSHTKELLAFANNNIIYIYNTTDKHLLQTIKTNEGSITLISFIKNSKYLITGTKNGRVMQYRYDGRSALSRLCSFGQGLRKKAGDKLNYVSAFAQEGNTIACSGYGGVITVLKPNSYQTREYIQTSKTKVSALSFLDSYRLISATVDGVIQIHTLKKYQQTKTLKTSIQGIKEIVHLKNRDFILICGEAKRIMLIDVKNLKVAHPSYITFKDDITHMKLSSKNVLFVVTEYRNVYKVQLPSSDQLKDYIFKQELDKAYDLIERDPTLKGSREHKRVEVMYEKLFAKATNALVENNEKEAHKLLKMLEKSKSKKGEIAAMFQAFKHYPRFKALYLEKKYNIAYIIAEKHPSLKRTVQFKKMEEIFKEHFAFAQKQILLGEEALAKEILSPYATVSSKKNILSLILSHNKHFLSFLQAIENKQYNRVEILARENPLLQEIPTYITLQKSLQTDLKQIKELTYSLEFEEAKKRLDKLQGVDTVDSEVQELYEELKSIEALQDAYTKDDFVSCYEIIDKNPTIKDLELYQLLEKHWSKLFSKCEEFALKGDFKSIKTTLGELIKVKTRAEKIGDLLRLSFFTQIKALLAKQNFRRAESIIYSYNDIFGIDREMRFIMKTFEKVTAKKLAITLGEEKSIPRDAWRDSSKIMD
jgi:hypothetical protein